MGNIWLNIYQIPVSAQACRTKRLSLNHNYSTGSIIYQQCKEYKLSNSTISTVRLLALQVVSETAPKSSHALQAASELKLQKAKFGAKMYDTKLLVSPQARSEQNRVSSATEFAFLWWKWFKRNKTNGIAYGWGSQGGQGSPLWGCDFWERAVRTKETAIIMILRWEDCCSVWGTTKRNVVVAQLRGF